MVRWSAAALVVAGVFAVTVWVSGTFVLPLVLASSADRWVVAAGLGVAVAALAALWGQSWATLEGHETPGGDEEPCGAHAPPEGSMTGDRSVTTGGDISGIASTGDGTVNTQR